jgi:group I intron endonuclease
MEEISGFIYKITNLTNGKIYVGQTVTSIANRFIKHASKAKRGSDDPIGRAIRKYGRENFIIEVLEELIISSLDDREAHYITSLDCRNPEVGYNVCAGGSGVGRGPDHPNYGKPFTDEAKRKASASQKKRWDNMPLEEREAIRQKLKEVEHTPEWVDKISKAQLGRQFSIETRKRMSESGKRRPPVSEETREKLRKASKGRVISEAAREQMRLGCKMSKPISEETRQKQRAAKLGKKRPQWTEEQWFNWRKAVNKR